MAQGIFRKILFECVCSAGIRPHISNESYRSFLRTYESENSSVCGREVARLKFSKREKILLILFIIAYVVVGIINMKELSKTPMSEAFKNLGRRWIVNIGGFRMNPMTVIMGLFIALILIVIAYKMGRNFKLIPDRKQSFFEYLMEFVYEIVEEAIPDPKLVRPTFVLAMTLFLFISLSNLIGGAVPGINVVGYEDGTIEKITLFTDTWPAPTADLNTDLTYALMVLVISHVFAIKSKGFKTWLKGWIDPSPIMLPLNIIGELAKPISHSLRLFGNIAGGAILVYILSYLVKYFFLPIVFWGFFGIFVGLIQAFVFTILAIAYISSQLS
ncbi:MAG: F0F1 ATP synthase subunit A [Thermotoga sp.]|nr:MAG: F0F1 ATP synthase subunit A [Thermotoga sp.]